MFFIRVVANGDSDHTAQRRFSETHFDSTSTIGSVQDLQRMDSTNSVGGELMSSITIVYDGTEDR